MLFLGLLSELKQDKHRTEWLSSESYWDRQISSECDTGIRQRFYEIEEETKSLRVIKS